MSEGERRVFLRMEPTTSAVKPENRAMLAYGDGDDRGWGGRGVLPSRGSQLDFFFGGMLGCSLGLSVFRCDRLSLSFKRSSRQLQETQLSLLSDRVVFKIY